MALKSYALGVDFGTLSGRAVLVDTASGREVATRTHPYRSGVIDEVLGSARRRLPPNWALQDPADYFETLRRTIPPLLRDAGVSARHVVGIGIDFTSCTALPVMADGTPLCEIPSFRKDPHAWVKLWKHHAAQPEADRINRVARERRESWLPHYGGRISSEFLFPKALQILDESPRVFEAMDLFVEAADWVVRDLTGELARNSCAAGYKALYDAQSGSYPGEGFCSALDPGFSTFVSEKLRGPVLPIGMRAGGLRREWAQWLGLAEGTPVAVPAIDAHVSVPAATIRTAGEMLLIMGTSTCHLTCAEERREVPGICGVVKDGILPGLWGYEAGQSAVGDMFAWFVETAVPGSYHAAARRAKQDLHQYLAALASRLEPGGSGLLALDWWNGNRSVLVDADLSGLVVGATLKTRPEDVFRALIEGTAFGTRAILDAFDSCGLRPKRLLACGGLPTRNPLLVQIYADVTGYEISLPASDQTSSLGAAMFGAVAAGEKGGGFSTIGEASARMSRLRPRRFRPRESARRTYDDLYRDYLRLHDYFGRGGNDVMKRLSELRGGSA